MNSFVGVPPEREHRIRFNKSLLLLLIGSVRTWLVLSVNPHFFSSSCFRIWPNPLSLIPFCGMWDEGDKRAFSVFVFFFPRDSLSWL